MVAHYRLVYCMSVSGFLSNRVTRGANAVSRFVCFFRSFAGDFLFFFDTSYCEHVALEERLHRFGMRG